jgi:hypothetical protein
MSSLCAWAHRFIALMMVTIVTAACVLPDLPALKDRLASQQDRDEDDHDDDERDNQVKTQLAAMCSGLRRSRQELAATNIIAAGHHPRQPLRSPVKPAGDRSHLRPRLFLRLQI